MNKLFCVTLCLLSFISINCFADRLMFNYSDNNVQRSLDPQENRSTNYHVYQPAPQRPGYECNRPAQRYRAETYGDTTYYYSSPQSSRRGYE